MTGQEAAGLVKSFNDAGARAWAAPSGGGPAGGQGECARAPPHTLARAPPPSPCPAALPVPTNTPPPPPSSHAVDITGAVLTKMDGDSRGGAALSVKEVGAACQPAGG